MSIAHCGGRAFAKPGEVGPPRNAAVASVDGQHGSDHVRRVFRSLAGKTNQDSTLRDNPRPSNPQVPGRHKGSEVHAAAAAKPRQTGAGARRQCNELRTGDVVKPRLRLALTVRA